MKGRIVAGVGAALLAVLLGAQPMSASVPQIINFQGRLVDPDGTPEAGILSVGFALYDADTGGTPLWSETQTVAFADGFYSVMLGTVTPLPIGVLNDPLHLSVTVAGTELLPRMQVASVAFALRASVAEGLTTAASGPGSGLDADSIDGLDATDFAAASHTHPAGDADTLDGIDSTGFASASHTHAAGDADTLDGLDSTGFAPALHDHDPAYVNVSGDTMTGTLTVPTLDLGPGADDDLVAADVTTLTGGGDATALHTHAGDLRPWVNVGSLGTYANWLSLVGMYPPTDYEWAVRYNQNGNMPPVRVKISTWNAGVRIMTEPYVEGDGGAGPSPYYYGGAAWFYGNPGAWDDACTAAGDFYHQYWRLNAGSYENWASNGCAALPTVFVRSL